MNHFEMTLKRLQENYDRLQREVINMPESDIMTARNLLCILYNAIEECEYCLGIDK